MGTGSCFTYPWLVGETGTCPRVPRKFNRRFSNDSCHKPIQQRKVSAEWSSRSSISLTSNRARRGSKWGPWCSKFPISRPSPHRNGEPSCRTKSTLFTNVWGTLEWDEGTGSCFTSQLGVSETGTCPLVSLSSEETLTFLGGNHHFPRSKLRLFSEPYGGLTSVTTKCNK